MEKMEVRAVTVKEGTELEIRASVKNKQTKKTQLVIKQEKQEPSQKEGAMEKIKLGYGKKLSKKRMETECDRTEITSIGCRKKTKSLETLAK